MATRAYVRMSVVKQHVKDGTREGDMRVGKDALDALDEKIGKLIENAMRSAISDKRKTLKARDFGE